MIIDGDGWEKHDVLRMLITSRTLRLQSFIDAKFLSRTKNIERNLKVKKIIAQKKILLRPRHITTSPSFIL